MQTQETKPTQTGYKEAKLLLLKSDITVYIQLPQEYT